MGLRKLNLHVGWIKFLHEEAGVRDVNTFACIEIKSVIVGVYLCLTGWNYLSLIVYDRGAPATAYGVFDLAEHSPNSSSLDCSSFVN